MTHQKKILANVLFIFVCAAISAQNIIDWKIAELPHVQEIKGKPETITTSLGKAVAFGGNDAYFLETNPLKELTQFTLEIIFKPDGDGRFDQRFLHIGTSGERLMLETRVNRDSTWYFDTHFTLSNGVKLTMISDKLTHPTDRWYHAALIVDGTRATVYIDGIVEFNEPLVYAPINEGVVSIGVRQNLVSWFKGSMYRLRITPRPLILEEFLNDHHALNK